MIQEQVTPEEWRALCAAPWAVGWYMATATGGKVQEVRELLTLRTTLHQALERDCEHDLIGAVAATVLGETPSEMRWSWQPGDRPAMLRAVAAAWSVATRLPSGRAFRHWLMDLAHDVAAAEKDGGWMGASAEAIHRAEQTALNDLAVVLEIETDTRLTT
jgi:hypothetical protein